jgi:hypothetical protein
MRTEREDVNDAKGISEHRGLRWLVMPVQTEIRQGGSEKEHKLAR